MMHKTFILNLNQMDTVEILNWLMLEISIEEPCTVELFYQ
jgi:hypothetical protein